MRLPCTKVMILIWLSLTLANCAGTKKLTPNQYLIVKQSFAKNDKPLIQDPVLALSQTKVNQRLFGIPLKLNIYQLANNQPGERFDRWLSKKKKRKERLEKALSEKQVQRARSYAIGFNEWLKRTGEPPALVDSVLVTTTKERFKEYYQSLGYFTTKTNATVNYLDGQKATVDYQIETGPRFTLDSITPVIASQDVDSIFKAHASESLLQSGKPFVIEQLNNERERIVALMNNNGILNFQQRSIRFKAFKDSLGIDTTIPLVIEIKNAQVRVQDTLREVPYRVQKIDNVNVFIEEKNNPFSIYTDSIVYKGITLYSVGKLKYKPEILTKGITIEQNSPYSSAERKKTYGYFNSLQNFKYPSITYTPAKKDSTQLNASIFLQPKERFSLGFNADVSHSNIQDIGITLGSSLLSRNVFRGAEILELGIKGTIGSSRDVAEEKDAFFNLFEVGGTLNLRLPRFWAPRMIAQNFTQNTNARTNILLGISLQENIGLDRQNFTGSLEYVWQPKKFHTLNFKLADIEFVNNKAIENYFNVYRNSYERLLIVAQSLGDNNPYLNEQGVLNIPQGTARFIEDVLEENTTINKQDNEYTRVATIAERQTRLTANNFIVGSSLTWIKNNQESLLDENFSQFRMRVEWVGNLLSAALRWGKGAPTANGSRQIFNLTPSQYFKAESSYIKHWEVGRERILAMRAFSGIALPYGNANFIPFTRSYYAGGANDNRAWNAYKLGPGNAIGVNEFNEANFKLALNLEYRFPIIGPIKGALFVDAGNIWNVANNITDPEQLFKGFRDLQDIAVGSGVGFRYDFDYFVFRIDTAFKTYDPSLPVNDRWGSQIALKRAVFNVGINYPF